MNEIQFIKYNEQEFQEQLLLDDLIGIHHFDCIGTYVAVLPKGFVEPDEDDEFTTYQAELNFILKKLGGD
ncbi:hypothetical protein LCGC14_1267760 [marine sediment metagenome]|uniref:Uncharacterized protein n=1 Tax=marine sediment metagenome TaxID=412755 RepID=A0A0F9NFN7_9ZZZZ|nr:hypothetical protein [bacterium]